MDCKKTDSSEKKTCEDYSISYGTIAGFIFIKETLSIDPDLGVTFSSLTQPAGQLHQKMFQFSGAMPQAILKLDIIFET